MKKHTLYDPAFEHDACGIGAVVSIDGIASHSVVDDALTIVERLEHRAGKDATGEIGDGVGIMLQICHPFFRRVGEELRISLGDARDYGVGMFFLPQVPEACQAEQARFEAVCAGEGLPFLGWREVPVDTGLLSPMALASMPAIWQCFVGRPEGTARGLDFDRRLFVARRVFEKTHGGTYVVSLSSRTVVYKGMFLVHQLRRFYLDLQAEGYGSALALVHSRFSTNTAPSWERAHPNRMILHNGEINTIRGNVDRMLAREENLRSPLLDADLDKILPVVSPSGSDSAMLDNTLEFLVMGGMPLPLAVMVLLPEPWKNDSGMSREKRDLYRYYATMMEPWDGPAAILFSDGDLVGAALDRNGLRPARYCVTRDRRLILSSEAGVLDLPPEGILEQSRLEPGKLLLVDTGAGRIIPDGECKAAYAARQPYGEWLDGRLLQLSDLPIPNQRVPQHGQEERERLRLAFGYPKKALAAAILSMARDGVEPTASMGADEPLAVLSGQPRPLFDYFKQMFAQVTNPPLDAAREAVVTDTTVYLGTDGNLLCEGPENCTVLQINNPILTSVDLMKLRAMERPGFRVETVSLLYERGTSLEQAMDRLFADCGGACRSGANLLILSDRGVDARRLAIPSLLAVSAVEQYLIRSKRRTVVSTILESAEPWDVHHFAALLGYGARAVNPYLAQECVVELIDGGRLDKDYHTAVADYNKALLDGVVKIAAKMGVSTLQSYQSAQIFEALGLSTALVDRYFTNTVSPVEGIGLKELGEDARRRHALAFAPAVRAPAPEADRPFWRAQTVRALQEAVRSGSYERFREFSALAGAGDSPRTLRDLLDFAWDENGGIPLEAVESEEEIVKRFRTGAMSYGSLSQEAHVCLAQAMNRLGGRSNSGEGGEDSARYGTEKNSKIKQVASGRFGVTSAYLLSAEELQLKLAQGAKPGEGGHLPGAKVHPWIAKTRCSTPGVPLISPPPHHDIYSIEDLAQLIFDLKNANRRAEISVKLVSEAGVGTLAAGAAKAGAQSILISGYDGGTGAAPRGSISNAGLPWELGLAEAHQTLARSGLRARVRLETDGRLLTGRDVAVACMLGAETFGFATAPLVAMGCVMDRQCNTDHCPVGIATQDPELRKRFRGRPEHIMCFMTFVARELREIMARLGVRTVDALVGRTDLLCRRPVSGRAEKLDLSALLGPGPLPVRWDPAQSYDFHLEQSLDMCRLLPEFEPSFQAGVPHACSVEVSSTHRAVGTLLGSEITRRFGENLADDTYIVHCTGSGGQSFGAFLPKGLTLRLTGSCNDYLGKGLSGGKLIVTPDSRSPFSVRDNVIAGNVALYGATGGAAFLAGQAGERFCVRNSGALAVAEGCGDHGCEYMTRGRVAILGPTGKNFAAGMSGGVAYVLDEDHSLYRKLNKQMVSMGELTEPEDMEELRNLLKAHVSATKSAWGEEILAQWNHYVPLFKKVVPFQK